MIDLYRSAIRPVAGLAVSAAMAFALLGPSPAAAQSTFGTDQNSCDRGALSQILSTSKGNILGSAAGGALGGLLGSQFGKGGGNTVMTSVGVVGGALAGGYIGRSMDPTDQACVGQTLEHTPSNQTVAWRNPDNGSSYWVTPTSSYQGQSGQPCRNYVTQAVVNGETQRTDGVACRDNNGAWRPTNANAQGANVQGGPPPQPQPYGGGNGPVSSDTIFQVQQRLHDLGFYVRDNIDGRWGPRTGQALANFQRSKGLNPTGQIDDQTMAALGIGQQTQ
jgi:surface antigen